MDINKQRHFARYFIVKITSKETKLDERIVRMIAIVFQAKIENNVVSPSLLNRSSKG